MQPLTPTSCRLPFIFVCFILWGAELALGQSVTSSRSPSPTISASSGDGTFSLFGSGTVSSSSLSTGAVVGISIGCAAVVTLVVGGVVLYRCTRSASSGESGMKTRYPKNYKKPVRQVKENTAAPYSGSVTRGSDHLQRPSVTFGSALTSQGDPNVSIGNTGPPQSVAQPASTTGAPTVQVVGSPTGYDVVIHVQPNKAPPALVNNPGLRVTVPQSTPILGQPVAGDLASDGATVIVKPEAIRPQSLSYSRSKCIERLRKGLDNDRTLKDVALQALRGQVGVVVDGNKDTHRRAPRHARRHHASHDETGRRRSSSPRPSPVESDDPDASGKRGPGDRAEAWSGSIDSSAIAGTSTIDAFHEELAKVEHRRKKVRRMLTTFSKHEKRHRHRHRRRSLAPPALSPLLVQELTVPQESLDSDTVETLEADVAPMQSFGTHPSRRPSHGGPVTVKLGAQPLGVKYPGPQGVTGLPSTAAVSRSTAVVALSTPVDQPVEESALEKQAQAADASDMIVIPKATLLALLSSKPTQTPSRPAVLSGVAVPNLTALAMSAEPGPSNFLNIPRIQLRNHLRTANVGRERRAVV